MCPADRSSSTRAVTHSVDAVTATSRPRRHRHPSVARRRRERHGRCRGTVVERVGLVGRRVRRSRCPRCGHRVARHVGERGVAHDQARLDRPVEVGQDATGRLDTVGFAVALKRWGLRDRDGRRQDRRPPTASVVRMEVGPG